MRVIPAIDIIDGKCVRLIKGDYSKKKVYNENPLEVAKAFEDHGFKFLHLVDLDGAKSNHIVNHKVLEVIATKTNLNIDFGGGLKSNKDLAIAFECGAKKITGGSVAVRNSTLFLEWIEIYGPDKIILGSDVNGEKIAINGWLETSNQTINKFLSFYIDNGVKKNIEILANAKKKKISEINVCVMKRPRHDDIIIKLKEMDVTINYIDDGDIAGALSVIGSNSKNDIYYSTGGGPEGVIVAAALSCYGGQIQGRLVLDDEDKLRAKKLGITDFSRKYNISDMVNGDVIFCATGVTSGDLASGVKDLGNEFEVNTFALHKSQNTINSVKNIYNK